MNEIPNEPLTPAQLAIQRAQAFKDGTWTPAIQPPYTPPQKSRRERIADQVLAQFHELPGLTFGLSTKVNSGVLADISSDPLAVFDLRHHHKNQKEVSGGRLACHCVGQLQDDQTRSNTIETVKSCFTQLEKESVGYHMFWHVSGDSRTRLSSTIMDEPDSDYEIILCLKDCMDDMFRLNWRY